MSDKNIKTTGCAFDLCMVLGILFGPLVLCGLCQYYSEQLGPYFTLLWYILAPIIFGAFIGLGGMIALLLLFVCLRLAKVDIEAGDKLQRRTFFSCWGISILAFLFWGNDAAIQKQWHAIRTHGQTEACSSQTEEKRFWITSSSRKTHNSSCRWYGESKGYYSSTGTGNDCKKCGGAGYSDSVTDVSSTVLANSSAKERSTDGDVQRYWITSSSRKTHNASCRWYGESKGYYSSTGTGNNCRSCGGAGEDDSVDEVASVTRTAPQERKARQVTTAPRQGRGVSNPPLHEPTRRSGWGATGSAAVFVQKGSSVTSSPPRTIPVRAQKKVKPSLPVKNLMKEQPIIVIWEVLFPVSYQEIINGKKKQRREPKVDAWRYHRVPC